MGVLGRLFRRGGRDDSEECLHVALGPRWDQPHHVGKPERATSYWCAGCGAVFSAEEGRALLQRAEAAS
jgi:hypothetical protein